MAILYKKLNVIDRALDHFTQALNIRRELIGPLNSEVGAILLKIGQIHLLTGNLSAAFETLQEAYIIRKKNVGVKSNDRELSKLSCLMLYLNKKIEIKLYSSKGTKGITKTENGLRVMEMSFDLKEVFGEDKVAKTATNAPELFRNILGVERFEKIVAQTGISKS